MWMTSWGKSKGCMIWRSWRGNTSSSGRPMAASASSASSGRIRLMAVFIGWSALAAARGSPPPPVQHPLGEPPGRPGVADEVAGLVDLAAVDPVLVVEAVVAGVDDEDVVALDPEAGLPLPALEVLRPVRLDR